MSDEIKHECGVALLRIRGCATPSGMGRGSAECGGALLSLLLEKQRNRGQDGAGFAVVRLSPPPGEPAFDVVKSASPNSLADILSALSGRQAHDDDRIFLGHLRYATFGRGDTSFCHPFVHQSSCLNRALLLAGNFNLTDNRELFERYVSLGHHPDSTSDGYLVTQMVAHELGREFDAAESASPAPGLPSAASAGIPILSALRNALAGLDGAWLLCGATGDGWSFAVRDPHGIRPGFWYEQADAVAVASERPAIQAAFDCAPDEVREIPPGAALLVSPDGTSSVRPCLEPGERRQCTFERIYFSRANDAAIHRERKALGAALAPRLLDAVGGDLEHSFFSYIPNSAQVAFHGLLESLLIEGLAEGRPVRFGQVAVKDAKFRTFIADSAARRELRKHVYDVTYGLVRPGEDALVVLDDSIVRGNTMRRSILPMLDRLGPKRIVVASSAPPIRYPDCYGIDMSTLGELVAFQALVSLLGPSARAELEAALSSGAQDPLSALYARFPPERHEAEIARLLTPPGLKAEVAVVYQSVEGLRAACPEHSGDWYFTGRYPTPGGYRVLRRALENYLSGTAGRSY